MRGGEICDQVFFTMHQSEHARCKFMAEAGTLMADAMRAFG
jgi:hypothetical protein